MWKANADQLQFRRSSGQYMMMDNIYSNAFLQSYLNSNIYLKKVDEGDNYDHSNIGTYESPDTAGSFEGVFEIEDYWRSKYIYAPTNHK